MKTFNLQELSDYISQCIICKKEMYFFIKGNISSQKHRYTGKKVSIKTKMSEGQLISDSKEYPFSIRLSNSEILDGYDFLSKFLTGWTYINKRCKTCDFMIGTIYNDPFPKEDHIFPRLKLTGERVAYTMPGGKNVIIETRYFDSAVIMPNMTKIEINNKPLPSFPFEFETINSLKQLNKRLLTIRTFQ